MNTCIPPRLVPTEKLASYFSSRGIAHKTVEPLKLGVGHGRDQYRCYDYPGPADDETKGVLCECHTEYYIEDESGPHVAIGMRGPLQTDPHRGRGLAIGILANKVVNADDPNNPVPLFKGCPDPPGGPSFFIEDFTVCDGKAPICDWQLSQGKCLPELQGHGVYRIDIHVSRESVWAGVWQVVIHRSADGALGREYRFMGQTDCPDTESGFAETAINSGGEDSLDRGQGNAFIGTGFSDPNTRSWIDNIYIAHWRNKS